jgi:hypothetical protein
MGLLSTEDSRTARNRIRPPEIGKKAGNEQTPCHAIPQNRVGADAPTAFHTIPQNPSGRQCQ